MRDLFDDEPFGGELFAPAPAKPAGFIGPRWPVASLECDCGALDEVKEPCPDRLDCWGCHGLEAMRRRAPRYLPPRGAGRELTAEERRGLELDARR